ncbi:GNAT family N-acetyltransferase [Jatrophihabitans sp. YIM 134969]
MAAEIVHPLPPELLDPMYAAATRAYLSSDTGLSSPWRRRAVDLDLAWVARDAGRVVGTLRIVRDSLSVPGAPGRPSPRIPADLLTLVSVAPSHRRQGLLRQMLSASLTEAHDRGEPVSILVAAEYQIYGRFGYAPACWETTYEVNGFRPGAQVLGEPVGAMREIEPVEASDLAPPVYEAESLVRAGVIGRDDIWWDRELRRVGEDRAFVAPPEGGLPRHAVHVDPSGVVDGFVTWSVAQQDDGRDLGTLHVHEVLASTPVGYREVWRFLLGIDLIDRLHYPNRPVDDPLPWLLADARTAGASRSEDATWLRILDVPAALSARGYGVEGEIVLDVVDEAVGHWAGGRFRLTAGPEGATCVAAPEATADIRLPQSTLASLYLGGVRAALLGRTGGFDEQTPGAGARLDALFATPLAPWRATDF